MVNITNDYGPKLRQSDTKTAFLVRCLKRYVSIKKERKLKILLGILFILFSANSFALHQSQGNVKSIKALGGKIIFSVCTESSCNTYWLIPDSEYKNVVISMLLAAKVSGRLVWVSGSDTVDDGWPYNGARAFSGMDFKG